MRKLKKWFFFIALFSLTCNLYSQNENLLDSLLEQSELVKSEPKVINTINWLENTPFTQQVQKRKRLYAIFTAWLVNADSVTVTVNHDVLPFTKKNNELLIIFMGGWTKYSLENSYSSDLIKCNLAGIKSAIKVYKLGNGLVKDKEMEKIISLDEKGELENWIKTKLEKK